MLFNGSANKNFKCRRSSITLGGIGFITDLEMALVLNTGGYYVLYAVCLKTASIVHCLCGKSYYESRNLPLFADIKLNILSAAFSVSFKRSTRHRQNHEVSTDSETHLITTYFCFGPPHNSNSLPLSAKSVPVFSHSQTLLWKALPNCLKSAASTAPCNQADLSACFVTNSALATSNRFVASAPRILNGDLVRSPSSAARAD
jgi:hypothetical protein